MNHLCTDVAVTDLIPPSIHACFVLYTLVCVKTLIVYIISVHCTLSARRRPRKHSLSSLCTGWSTLVGFVVIEAAFWFPAGTPHMFPTFMAIFAVGELANFAGTAPSGGVTYVSLTSHALLGLHRLQLLHLSLWFCRCRCWSPGLSWVQRLRQYNTFAISYSLS